MPTYWITRIIILVMAVVFFIRGMREIRHFTKRDVPDQLAELVRQAHADRPFQTMWDIKVSDEMRDALQLPLTPQQIRAMDAAKEEISRFVDCHVISHKLKDRELSGVVSVRLNVSSRSGLYDLHVPDAKLRITVCLTGNRAQLNTKWVVHSVEQL